jgi:hypothetical protein
MVYVRQEPLSRRRTLSSSGEPGGRWKTASARLLHQRQGNVSAARPKQRKLRIGYGTPPETVLTFGDCVSLRIYTTTTVHH